MSTDKKITRLSLLLGILLAATSHAKTTINFKGELDLLVSHNQPAGPDSDSTLGVESNGMTTSWLGVHGSHELTDGVTLIAAVESFFPPGFRRRRPVRG